MSLLHRAAFVLGAAVAMVAAGCNDDGTEGLGPEPQPALALTLLPQRLSIPQAWFGTSTLTVVRNDPAVGTVTLVATGVPEGLTVELAPAELVAGKTEATMRVAVAAEVPIGRRSFVMEARAQGIATAQATVWVDVIAAEPGAIRLFVSGVTLFPGGTDTATLYITRVVPFAGDVALVADNVPTGLQVAFTPNPTLDATMQVIVTAAADMPYGTHSVTLVGSGAGIRDVRVRMSVAVQNPDPPRIELAVSPDALTIRAGGAGTATVNIVRLGGFTNGVDFWMSDWPVGLDVTFTPSGNVLGPTAQVRVEVAAGTPPGEYVVNVFAIESGTGWSDVMALDTLVVTVPPGP